MENKKKSVEHYLKIIDEIEKVRSKNNMNWMDVLRLTFIHAPDEAKKLMKRINQEDDKISKLFEQLSK